MTDSEPLRLRWYLIDGRYCPADGTFAPPIRGLLSSHATKGEMLRFIRAQAMAELAQAQRAMANAQEMLAFADAVEIDGLPPTETGAPCWDDDMMRGKP